MSGPSWMERQSEGSRRPTSSSSYRSMRSRRRQRKVCSERESRPGNRSRSKGRRRGLGSGRQRLRPSPRLGRSSTSAFRSVQAQTGTVLASTGSQRRAVFAEGRASNREFIGTSRARRGCRPFVQTVPGRRRTRWRRRDPGREGRARNRYVASPAAMALTPSDTSAAMKSVRGDSHRGKNSWAGTRRRRARRVDGSPRWRST